MVGAKARVATILVVLGALLGAFGGTATAEEQVLPQTAQLEALKEMAKQASAACKREIVVEVDWASARQSDLRRYDASAYCGVALDALKVSCGEKDMRDAVQRGLAKVVCSFGDSRSLYLDGDTFHYRIDWNEKAKREVFEEFLADRL